MTDTAQLELLPEQRARVSGTLGFDTVGALLPLGSAAIRDGTTGIMDLGGVAAGDSAGLALLLEWLSVARQAGKTLRYENIPSQLHQLARLSEVEELLLGHEASA